MRIYGLKSTKPEVFWSHSFRFQIEFKKKKNIIIRLFLMKEMNKLFYLVEISKSKRDKLSHHSVVNLELRNLFSSWTLSWISHMKTNDFNLELWLFYPHFSSVIIIIIYVWLPIRRRVLVCKTHICLRPFFLLTLRISIFIRKEFNFEITLFSDRNSCS